MPKSTNAYTDDNFKILPNLEAIAHFEKKMLGTSYSYLDVLAHEHAVAFTVAKMMNKDLLTETKSAIESAMQNGTDFNTFKKRLKPYLMTKGWWGEQAVVNKAGGDPKDGEIQKVQLGSTRRLRTIYQTNLHSSYAAGQWDRIQQNKELLPYLQYMPSVAGKKRDDHKQYYNIVRPVDDPIWQSIYPPNGYGCLCWVKQLTKRQAEKSGISEEQVIETETVENPRTGQKQQVPVGIEPSFAHNHGDRLGALLKIAEDKHGRDFTKQLIPQLDDYVMRLIKPDTVELVSFAGIVARQTEIDRLVSQGVRPYEAELADQYQQNYDVKLVGYEEGVHKKMMPNNPPDLAELNNNLPEGDWQTLDIMYKTGKDADIKAFNNSFNKSTKMWRRAKENIIKHLNKADIVPMHLDSFDTQTRTKILSFVLSLSKEQQKQIVLITDKKL